MNQLNVLHYFIFVFVALTSPCWASISASSVSVSNASVVQLPSQNSSTTTTSSRIKVFGGMAGPSCANGESTCNNCTTDIVPCNEKRISPDAYLHVEFTSTATSFSDAYIFVLAGETDIVKIGPAESSDFQSSPTISGNTTLFVDVKWSKLCQVFSSDSTCATGFIGKTLQVGISTNGDDTTLEEVVKLDIAVAGEAENPSTPGVYSTQYFTPCPVGSAATGESDGGYCDIEIARGDRKVYLFNEAHRENFNRAPTGVNYKYLRVFYKEGTQACTGGIDFSIVTPQSSYKDISFTEQDGEFFLDDSTITDLTNDVPYFFRFANVDEAGNIFYYSGDQNAPGAYQYLNCTQHSAIPSEVVGLLDGKECFIATAAYGTSMSPQLDILRKFRDQYLKATILGRWFVKKYYAYSPQWAQKIKKREAAKALVRGTLSPVISMAQWMILHGLKSFILLSVIGFFLGYFAIRRLIGDHE